MLKRIALILCLFLASNSYAGTVPLQDTMEDEFGLTTNGSGTITSTSDLIIEGTSTSTDPSAFIGLRDSAYPTRYWITEMFGSDSSYPNYMAIRYKSISGWISRLSLSQTGLAIGLYPGVLTPEADLDVYSNCAITCQPVAYFRAVNSGFSDDVVKIYGGANSSSYNALNIVDGSANTKLLVRGDGNVGIGTASPESGLQVAGSCDANPSTAGVHVGLSGTYSAMQLANANGGFIDFSVLSEDYSERILAGTGAFEFYANGNSTPTFKINSGAVYPGAADTFALGTVSLPWGAAYFGNAINMSDEGPIINATSTNGSSGFRINVLGCTDAGDQLFRVQSEGTNLLTVWGDGDVTLNDADAILTVGSGADSGTVSAGIFVDRTKFYEGDALSEIAKITGMDGEIDHDSLPTFARKDHKIKIKSKKGKLVDENGDTYDEAVEPGRDIGAMVSILTVGIQQLIELNATQQTEIDKLKAAYEALAERVSALDSIETDITWETVTSIE